MEQDAGSRWKAFAATGEIQEYLAYKQQSAAEVAAQKGAVHGCDRDAGAGTPGSEIPRGG